ncbi:MAG: hypothetical protein HY226_04820 [Candidatus Vogelbacteria bacterium]|nr:hypothetical protein [Candidatus Vogelbacteria bacterium]
MEKLNLREKESVRIMSAKSDLIHFSKKHKISSLEDRVNRGVNLIGMFALHEMDAGIRDIAKKLGAPYEDLLRMTLDIQQSGPWKYADKLKDGKDPIIKAWITLEAANTLDKGREMQVTGKEFIQDLDRMNKLVDEASNDPELFYKKAAQFVLEESKRQFRVEDGVPISEHENAFLAMAINGYGAGVMQDADGILYIGAEKINDETLTNWGLKTEQRDDGRGRIVTFYINEKGELVAKKLL